MFKHDDVHFGLTTVKAKRKKSILEYHFLILAKLAYKKHVITLVVIRLRVCLPLHLFQDSNSNFVAKESK